MIKTLDRYIFSQLVGPFLFGFFMFVVVIAIDPLMSALQNIVNENVPATTVIRWFLYRMPQDMMFTFPMSVLLSSLLVFGRMSKDSETTAMRAGGINFYRIMVPVIVFALTITGISIAFNELVVPYSNRRANEIRRGEIMRLVDPEATENSIMRASDGGFVYARKVFEAAGTMEKVLVEYYDAGVLVRRLSATSARWLGTHWLLNGVVDQRYRDGRPASTTTILEMPVTGIRETPADFARQSKRPNEMSYSELSKRIETYERTQFMETTELKVDLAMKTSLPFASFFFAIIGASFGLTSYRSGAFIGFGVAIMIIFIYYVLMSISTALGKSGVLPVMLSAWMQNIIFAVVGSYLVSKINA
ncbi:MAG TPA: LptF/LptG family permease [Candidatus Ozemobacteraceae bacterium]|nr:LptF/LptG family permease [Candidatus Ozemobacteraceae bacterium]